ncbi:MAG: hypothetical protein ACREVG_12395, partial [Burkholderiales bacterium]
MRSRRALRSIAKVLVAALLFTQAAFAIAACDWLDRAPAQAIAQTAALPYPQVDSRPDNRADSLCVAHCLGEFQSLDTHQLPVFALPTIPVLEVRTPSSSSATLA